MQILLTHPAGLWIQEGRVGLLSWLYELLKYLVSSLVQLDIDTFSPWSISVLTI